MSTETENTEDLPTEYEDRCDKAIEHIFLYSGIDGDEHKLWTLDQVLRILAGDKYDALVEEYEEEDKFGEKQYVWDTGIAP